MNKLARRPESAFFGLGWLGVLVEAAGIERGVPGS